MQTSIDFLKAIGHTERVYVRCLSPKNTPQPELEARGMTYQDKSGQTKKSNVNGYIDLQTGELHRRYGKEYKPVTDGWGHLLELNQQGYGVYFVVGHGGERNSDITHGSTMFHESDRATLEHQQLEIDRITSEFGKPTAVVKTRKSLHAYWASSETISIDTLPTYQRRWLQYSNCDDSSLADPAQLMRLPGFDHLAWNPETQDFDRVQCELLQLNDVKYSLAEFDRVLPVLDLDRYCRQSITELTESDADDRDMRSLAQYLTGFDNTGKWLKAKCPSHGGESSDSLHIDPQTGGFICHAGCSSSAVYNAAKAVAVAAGHRFEVVSDGVEKEFDGGKPHFTTSWEGGLKWETVEKNDDGETRPVRKLVGNHLEAIAYCESPDGTGAGVLIKFRTQRGKAHQVLVPRGTLTGDGSEALRFLADRGYHFQRKQKQMLLDYLFGLGCEVVRVYTISDKTGWVNGSFLTPAKTYGDLDLRFRDPEPDNTLTEIKGSLEGWKSKVAALCSANSRLIFSLGTVFAAALLEPAQIESGGFHLVGTTSIGKTTSLNVAASVAGLKNVPNWRSTSNALEGKAAEFNHGLLPLDEIGQADPQTVGASAYMLGNGQGKARMTKSLTNTKPKTWELLFLSTGEVSMTDYLRQAKIPAKGGMEARMPSIPADAGKGYGAFEDIHGYDTPKSFVDALETSIRQQQGTALDEYLTRLVEVRTAEGFDKELRERVHSIATSLSQQFNDTAIGRVAVRFALVQVGLEQAHSFGLLPFPLEQCGWAVNRMFEAWVTVRGGEGSIEIKEACNKIELLFESNQHGDRIYEVGTTNPIVRNLLAYKVYDVLTQTLEYLVPVRIFNDELANGVDRSQLITKLQELGYLKLSVEDDRNTVKRTILGKRRSFFAFREFWVEQKEDDFGSDQKTTGHTGHTGQQPETSSESDIAVSRTLRDSENSNGTHGTATGQPTDRCPVCPVAENSTGQERDTLEPSPEASLGSTVPCVPCVPLKKHVTQNALEEINQFKIGDRVKLGDDIITIEKIENDFIGGRSDDGSYIGGNISCVKLVSIDEVPVQLTPETIAAGEIEYEC